MQALVIGPAVAGQETEDHVATLDLAAIAQVARGDRVEVGAVNDRTLELFERTLAIVEDQIRQPVGHESSLVLDPDRFVPENNDLRERFLFAETLGSYSTLHDLLDANSPARRVAMSYDAKARAARLTRGEVDALYAYRDQIHDALMHASDYLLVSEASGYSSDELLELNKILEEARARIQSIDAILGEQVIHEIEDGVRRLYDFRNGLRSVQRSIDGIFFIDQEVMFMPTNDLIDIVNTLFRGIGNPYVAEHVDGMLLLAARNLLIEAVSFYSYYGKQQIYTAYKRNRAGTNRGVIAHHIRNEIKKLFRACMTDNRLVLKRVMHDAEREFEISADVIAEEAQRTAEAVVQQLLPPEPPPEPVAPQTLMERLSKWLFR